jgi:hypothetical protein
MPAKFFSISPMVWDRTFRRLSKNAKLVALYAWTAPARSSEGLSRLPVTYIAGDTAISEEEVLSALEELQAAGIIDYDEASETLLDRALKWNPIKNGVSKETGEVVPDNRQKGALRQIGALIDSPLLPSFVKLASEFSPDLAAAIFDTYPHLEPSQEPLGSPSKAPPKVRLDSIPLREESIRAVVENDQSQSLGSVSGSDFGSSDSEGSKIGAPLSETGDSLGDDLRGWSWQSYYEDCVVCGSGTTAQDPEGRTRHPGCSDSEGGF